MERKNRWFAIVAIIIVIMLILGSVSLPLFMAHAQSLSELQDQYSKLQSQLQQNQNSLSQNSASQQANSNNITQLQHGIDFTQQQIDNLNSQIDVLDEVISEKQQQINKVQRQKNENTKLFLERLRARYMMGDTPFLNVLMSSSGLVDFLTREQMLISITVNDTELIQSLKKQSDEIETDQAAIIKTKNNLDAKRQQQNSKQDLLSSQKINLMSAQAKLSDQASALKAEQESLQKAMRDADQKIEELSQESTGNYVGGDMVWPLQGITTTITCDFNYRYNPISGQYEFHNGLDITKEGGGTYGYPIRAANAGTIIAADYSKFYGNELLIDHGGGTTTLYGHCSSYAAGIHEGVKVKKGQVIAYVGSTGWSTGPHLHFSVIVDGQYVNPLNYTYYNQQCDNSKRYRTESNYYKVKP